MTPQEYQLTQYKRNAFGVELAVVAIITALVFWLEKYGIIDLASIKICALPVLPNEYTLSDTRNTLCLNNFIAELATYAFIVYGLFCSILIASPLKASPLMLWRGDYLLRKDGKNPNFLNALRYVFLGRLLPLSLAALYIAYHDFTLQIHGQWKILFLMLMIVYMLNLFEKLKREKEFVFDEFISGLALKLTPKAQNYLEKKCAKKSGLSQRINYKFSRFPIGIILGTVLFTFFSINIVHEGQPPADFNTRVYTSTPPQWDDNGYLALAGLNAPADITDFYTFGRDRVKTVSQNYERLKKAIGIEINTADTEKAEYTAIEAPQLLWNEETQAFDCLYNMHTSDQTSCTTQTDLKTAIDQHAVLWARFNSIPNHSNFSIPDHDIFSTPYHGATLIALARVKAAQISTMKGDAAFDEWKRYTRLYLDMAHTRSDLVEKVVYMILVGIQTKTLETILFHDPAIAKSHADEINEILAIPDVTYFRADTMVMDDYRLVQPYFMAVTGILPYQQKIVLECFDEASKRASLSAAELFEIYEKNDVKLCKKQFPDDPDQMILKAFFDPGDPYTNIIHALLMPVSLKAEEILVSMHLSLNNIVMARMATDILKQDIKTTDVTDFIKQHPANNPATGTIYEWNAQNRMIIAKNPLAPENPRKFFVNTKP